MSLLANTLQRPAMLAGLAASSTMPPTSSMSYSSRLACWSMKEPVPAAQSPLVW